MSVLLAPDLQAPTAPHLDLSDRSERALRQVDVRLATLGTNSEKHLLLSLLIEGWQYRYAQFVCRAEGDLDPLPRDEGADASDYLLVIAGLGARLSGLARG